MPGKTSGNRIMQKPGTWISICFSSLEEESKADIPISAAGEVEPVLTAAASELSEEFKTTPERT